jgi:ubiquitin C-terminal hydrolase
MSLLNHSPSPVDPSNYLRALGHKISSIRETPFEYNTQQDVPEILRIILDEFKGFSPLAENILSTTLRSTITCDTCFCSSVQEEKCDMLNLPTKKHITASLNQLLQTESLLDENMWFCPQCLSHQISTKETHITSCGSVLIIQLNRFSNFNGDIFKDNRLVECLPNSNHILKLPIQIDDTVSFSHEFSLVATINYSGNLNAGHYWTFIGESISNSWLQCNDRSVLKVKPSALNNNSSYVLFYVKS